MIMGIFIYLKKNLNACSKKSFHYFYPSKLTHFITIFFSFFQYFYYFLQCQFIPKMLKYGQFSLRIPQSSKLKVNSLLIVISRILLQLNQVIDLVSRLFANVLNMQYIQFFRQRSIQHSVQAHRSNFSQFLYKLRNGKYFLVKEQRDNLQFLRIRVNNRLH